MAKTKEKAKEIKKTEKENLEQEKSKKEKSEEETLENIIEPQEPQESFESSDSEQRISRPINLTLSSGQTQTAPIWQEKPIENLEQSIQEIPSQREEPENPEEIYKPNTIQENKFYDFETGKEIRQTSKNELMETRSIEPPSLSSGRQFSEGLRTTRMIQSADMQQIPFESDSREEKIYSTRQTPDKEREMSSFKETAEDTVRKYK